MASKSGARAGRNRDALVGGLVLVVLGVLLLAAQYVQDIGRLVPLIIGLGLLGLFALRRDYGLLVGGAIVSGVGVGIYLATTLQGDAAASAIILSLAAGFLGIWLVSYLLGMAERHWWPLVPGLVLATVGGAIALGGTALNLLSLWPVVLIVIGALLLSSWLLGARRAA